MERLDPLAVQARLAQGAVLVDIREADEHAREHISGACSVPLSRLQAGGTALPEAPLVFACASGVRTQGNAALLQQAAGKREAVLLDGGLQAWKRAGLPVSADARAPLPLMRQVQLIAGSLVLIGAVLGTTVSPWWHGLSAFVGAGLVMAGATGFCGMARLLVHAPWNRNG